MKRFKRHGNHSNIWHNSLVWSMRNYSYMNSYSMRTDRRSFNTVIQLYSMKENLFQKVIIELSLELLKDHLVKLISPLSFIESNILMTRSYITTSMSLLLIKEYLNG